MADSLKPNVEAVMRTLLYAILMLASLFQIAPALAQQPGPQPTNGYNLSWSALDPGDDWAAQTIQSVFPVNNAAAGTGAGAGAGGVNVPSTGAAANVIGLMAGQLTGFVSAIAMAYLCYITIMNIHRVAESSVMLTDAMTSLFVVRIGFAAIMMFPLTGGFSTGQAVVVKTAMWGIGMARALYMNATQAIGPGAMIIAAPHIPGTSTTVINLIQSELCRALINQATGTATSGTPMVPDPTPITWTSIDSVSSSVAWWYSMSPTNETGNPVCGSVTIEAANQTAANPGADGVFTTLTQKNILQQVINNDIRPGVNTIAAQIWSSKQSLALANLSNIYQTATADYINQLTQWAQNATAQMRSEYQNTADLQNTQLGSGNTQIQMNALGWSGAGAYYLQFAKLNAQTLALLSATPSIKQPSYEGLGVNLRNDLAPIVTSAGSFLYKLTAYVQTQDAVTPPSGGADLTSGGHPDAGGNPITQLFNSTGLNRSLLTNITTIISPIGNQWTDPFGGLMQLGNLMVQAAITGLGLAAGLSSNSLSWGTAILQGMVGNLAGAGSTIAAHSIVEFLATPIFMALFALLVPGLMIAFLLPMIPWVMWMGGVAGYLILVCEAVIAVPLWMLAHMTFEGPGLHGRAMQGYELMFNILFRPVLMIIGLFLGYFVFAAMSWLVRLTFGIAANLTLASGDIDTSFCGLFVLLGVFVLIHIYLALISFRLISLIPHHMPALLGLSSANRVDMEQFGRDAALIGVGSALPGAHRALSGMANKAIEGTKQNSQKMLQGPRPALTGPAGSSAASSGRSGMDSTLRSSTDVTPPGSQDA